MAKSLTYWSALPAPLEPDEPEHIFLQGAVLVHARRRGEGPAEGKADQAPNPLEEPSVQPWRELVHLLAAPTSRR